MNDTSGKNKLAYGYVFARGGSKGVPGKNIRPLVGKPLIEYAIGALRESRYVSRVIVSTDDEAIARAARDCGAEVPFMRPAELARDDSSELHAWKHALAEAKKEGVMPDIFVSAPATSPLRSPRDIDCAIEMLEDTGCDMVLGVTPSSRNPYFNMVSRGEDGRIAILMTPPDKIVRRQDAPPVYDITTVVYAARAEYVDRCEAAFSGDVRSIVIPPERSLDIDTLLDFAFAEFMLKRG